MNIYPCKKGVPADIFTDYLYRDSDFILVKDPKHNEDYFHYTIWSLNGISTIFDMTRIDINDLKRMINKVDKMDIFSNEKKFFTFPPTHDGMHLHIVPNNYVSYRPRYELYDYNDLDNIMKNIQKVKTINKQKKLSLKLELKFRIGVIIIKDIYKIHTLETVKATNNLDYIIVIRQRHPDAFLDKLIENNKFINMHLVSKNLNNYNKKIMCDYLQFL